MLLSNAWHVVALRQQELVIEALRLRYVVQTILFAVRSVESATRGRILLLIVLLLLHILWRIDLQMHTRVHQVEVLLH